MKLENWAFVMPKDSKIDTMVLPEDFKKMECRLVGEVYGRAGSTDGRAVCTSPVREFDGKIAKTRSGSIYELGTKNKDYQHFIDACKSDEIKVLKNWSVGGGYLSGYVFEGGKYENPCGKFLSGWVISQDIENNICVLDVNNKEQKVFVDWHDMDPMTYLNLSVLGTSSSLNSLLKFCHQKSKLILFGEHKNFLRYPSF